MIMLGRDDKYLARIMLKNKIYSSNGQAFEDLFSSIMKKKNKNFELVKPYGNYGDRKNDGFDKTTGEYYQVYAPENIEKATTINDAINKLEGDFNGLYDNWNSLCTIKTYNFVLNDNFKGVPPQVHQKLLSLEKEYPDITFNVFTANNLEDIFLSLDEDSIVDVVGCIANPSLQLDYSALTEVVNYLMNTREEYKREEQLNVPDFEKKIAFNNINDEIANKLRVASYQVGNLEMFFKRNSEFTKNDIQNRITECYLESIEKANDVIENKSDIVFMNMLDNICPDSTASHKNAALILAAFYFESCDIFESPMEE